MKHSSRFLLTQLCLVVMAAASPLFADDVLVEAESFASHGGWKLDTQFIDEMGSPYLIAHGLGTAVGDATTEVEFAQTGDYRVFVRTKDWVARWKAPGTPGRFQLLINNKPVAQEFGIEGAEWGWQDGGTVSIKDKNVTLSLHDLTGFDGRCDAILFTQSETPPPNDSTVLNSWRKKRLGVPVEPVPQDGYDLVVVGGGYAGMASAISAARSGCKVALIQNRPVLGGNGSSEVRVWAMGNIRRGKYPRIGEMVEEFCDHATKSPGRYEEFEDDKKETIVKAEKNIDLFLNHHAYKVDATSDSIQAVYAFDTRTGIQRRFSGKLFSDCTGHGTIGFLAEANWEMTPKGRMGMSNMWAWDEAETAKSFPKTPWALDMEMKDFPYPRDHHGQWFWESGFDKDPLGGAESIRDWNLRAVFGAFNAMKNRDGAAKHSNAYLTWIAYVGGPRESRRLMGDVILNQEDIVNKKQFTDGCVPSTWSIDLHYPKKQYAAKFPDNPFISIAEHDRRIDRSFGYAVPYRCFYSRNINNLFMAGRNISVTHKALGTTRVMKTCGMMGEVVGKAASVCVRHDCLPRDVYSGYLNELLGMLKLPGKAYRPTAFDEFVIPDDAMELASSTGPPAGLNPRKIGGAVVIDDLQAKVTGDWTSGAGLKPFVGNSYLYASSGSKAAIRFEFKAPKSGKFDVRFAYQPHQNRSKAATIVVKTAAGESKTIINQTKKPPLKNGFISVGQFDMAMNEEIVVSVAAADSPAGLVHVDAVQLMAVE